MAEADRDVRGRAWPSALLALALLHLLVSLRFPWDEPGPIAALVRPNPDLALLLALGALAALRWRSDRAGRVLILVGLPLAFVTRTALSAMPNFYGKTLDLYNDAQMLPGLAHLLLLPFGPVMKLGLVALALVAILLLLWALHRLSRLVLRPFVERELGPAAVPAALLFLAVGTLGAVPREEEDEGESWAQRPMLTALARELIEARDEWRRHGEFVSNLPAIATARRAVPSDLARLQGADVYVLFVESYGRLVFRQPETKAGMTAFLAEREAELSAGGFWVCSSFATSAVRGGNSALAHAQLLSGTYVASKRYFYSLLASDVEPIPHAFRRAGYRTLNAQPAMYVEWPEGRSFFGFGEDRFKDAFPYVGHTYHWGYMPDQFALAHLLETDVRTSERPLFLQYVGVTSHAPFNQIPPYFEDWSRVLEPGTYEREPARTFPIDWTNYAGHPRLEEAYLATLRYCLRTMVGFTLQLERPSVVLLLGDHQPPAIGPLTENDKTYEVPLHVMSNRVDLLEPFGASGFLPGFVLPDEYEAFDLSLVAEAMLRAFSTPSGSFASQE